MMRDVIWQRKHTTELPMNRFRNLVVFVLVGIFSVLAAAYAASPVVNERAPKGNSYHVFTKSLQIDESGVGQIPSRFKWSAETCVAGFDLQGNAVPDSRVMLRLYDPDHNFTAITAQMDLETAENLQRKLAEIVAKKRENQNFQHRPKLYDPSMIPMGTITGVNENGVAIIELEPKQAK